MTNIEIAISELSKRKKCAKAAIAHLQAADELLKEATGKRRRGRRSKVAQQVLASVEKDQEAA